MKLNELQSLINSVCKSPNEENRDVKVIICKPEVLPSTYLKVGNVRAACEYNDDSFTLILYPEQPVVNKPVVNPIKELCKKIERMIK